MAARDIILDMTDVELVKYYKYCMVSRFQEISFGVSGRSYHPTFEHNYIHCGDFQNKYLLLYGSNEMFLLEEMWARYTKESNFSKMCWWEAMKIFSTQIIVDVAEEEKTGLSSEVADIPKKETIVYGGETYIFIGSGLKRKVYVSVSPYKDHVIKVPNGDSHLGLVENKVEAETYQKNPDGNYAQCELLENGWLRMEYVEPAYFKKGDDYPEWTLGIAEHQVGYNNHGKLVAYDYGSEI